MPDLDADLVVVGLGGIGSATAFFAARRGARVLGLERFTLGGHANGASHDHSRIIRHSYHTEHYVRLTFGAYDAWREVERAARQQCLWITGGVDLFPPGAAIDHETYTAAMAAAGVPFELLGAVELRRRWPAMAVGDGVIGLIQAETGIVSPDRSVPLLQRLAREYGAELRGGALVRAVRSLDGGVEVDVEGRDRPVRAGAAVVAVDAWANELLAGLDTRLPLTILEEQVSYYRADDPGPFAIGRFPVWIWMDEPSFYGFPVFGRDGVKIAQDCGGREVEADERRDRPDPDILARTDGFAQRFFAGRLGPAVHCATCLYTLTPDRDFVVDRVQGHPHVLVGMGAAHGYKFAAWFGRTLATLAAGEDVSDDLSPFAMDRETLARPTGTTSWMM